MICGERARDLRSLPSPHTPLPTRITSKATSPVMTGFFEFGPGVSGK